MTALEAILARNRSGVAVGLPAWCTAHPATLAAILRGYRDDDAPVLIEATCNQVNQEGGYTGMTPAAFRAFIDGLAQSQGVDPRRLILGGDHLGPNPWRNRPAAQAMDKARAMVAGYVAAGFTKLHLDASMRCADDGDLPETVMAARAADLADVAETAARGQPVAYVIGTEVPVPGGEAEGTAMPAVTGADAALATVGLHRAAFARRGLDAAFARVIGLVVQPGVDFSNTQVHRFEPGPAARLSAAIADLAGPLYEAHSTDYQTLPALRALVAGHFAILKVGPELTFAYRQALFALHALARDLGLPTDLPAVLLAALRADPALWRDHVAPGGQEDLALLYGLSDRVRYVWSHPRVQTAVGALFAMLRGTAPPPGLVAQVTGGLVRSHDPATLPDAVIDGMVGAVVQKYRSATEGPP